MSIICKNTIFKNTIPRKATVFDERINFFGVYSLKKRITAYSRNCIRLRRSIDDQQQDFGFTRDGWLDVSAIIDWLIGSNGYLVTWYDQSGEDKHATQATSTRQALFVSNDGNGLPTLRFLNACVVAQIDFNLTRYYNFSLIANYNLANFVQTQEVCGTVDLGGFPPPVIWGKLGSNATIAKGGSSLSLSGGQFNLANTNLIMGVDFNQANGKVYKDGVNIPAYDFVHNPTGGNKGNAFVIASNNPSSPDSDEYINEIIICSVLTATQHATLDSNINRR